MSFFLHGLLAAAASVVSAATLDVTGPRRWPQAEWFVPGMIHGGFANLTDTAIGGHAHYRPGSFTVRIREDRLPAPLVLAHFDERPPAGAGNSRNAEEGRTEHKHVRVPGVLRP